MDYLRIAGVIISTIGMLIFCFGKKFFVFRYLLKDRSMFSQMISGFIIFIIGLALLFLSGTFAV